MESILEAAQRLLERGGAGFTMGELADEAGVSRATVYRRISGRDELARRLRARGVDPSVALTGPTRERILAAVRAVIDARQLSFTIEDVAREAGVGPATIYRKFGDREGLIRAYLERTSPRAITAEQLSDVEAPVEPTLRAFVASVLRFVLQHPGLVRIALLDDGAQAQELTRLRRGGRGTFAQLVTYLQAQMERGRLRSEDPRRLAIALIGMVMGSSLLTARLTFVTGEGDSSPSPDVEEHAAQLVALLLHGAAPPQETA